MNVTGVIRGLLLVLLGGVQLPWGHVCQAEASDAAVQPAAPFNVILIVSDDQGYHDLGCLSNNAVLTPHLDRLAAEGVRLTDFSVAWPACTPSRAAMLTGRYPQRNGMYDMVRNEAPDFGYRYAPGEYDVSFERVGGLDTREVLLSDLLQRAGYQTAIFGKWDLGSLKRYLPTSRGFDEFYGFVNTGIDYFTHERYGVPSMYRDLQPTEQDRGICSTELFRREATRFLRENHERPFFLYVPFNAPHNASNLEPAVRASAQASPQYLAMYPELQQQGRLQRTKRDSETLMLPNRALRRLLYCAAITEMDAAVGELLQLLDDFGIAERTLVVFFSDNGGSGGADNTPLRGRKSQLWEGGVRVPCVIRLPGRIPAGTVCSQFLTSLEVLPTIVELTGAKVPPEIVLDGFNMLPVLQGTTAEGRPAMFWQRQLDKAARVGSWKWVDSQAGGGLFDLSTDVAESQDLSDAHPEKLAELRQAFQQWSAEMDAADPRGPFRDY